MPTVLEKFEQKKAAYRKIYLLGDNKKPFIITETGIGANINKIHNHFSKSGRQARKLQALFAKELEDDMINLIWVPYSTAYSKLKNDSLKDFQRFYRPSLYWLENSTHYERIIIFKRKSKITKIQF